MTSEPQRAKQNPSTKFGLKRRAYAEDMSDPHGDRDEEAQGLLSDLASSCKKDDYRLDHCDLLLNAMDKQLDQLQIQFHDAPRKFTDGRSKEPVTCRWSQSVSKDTGLGSTNTDTPLSCRDLQTVEDHLSESSAGSKNDPSESEGPACKGGRSRHRAVQESHEEQAQWRLQHLLGTHCEGRDPAPVRPLSDSVCTEDFAQRFSQEMICEPRSHWGRSAEGTQVLHQRRGAGLPCTATKTHSDSHMTLILRPPQGKPPQISTSTPKTKYVAGVPVPSFDCVSIDSDLDSVSSERLHRQIHRQPGWHSFIESVQNLDELCKQYKHDITLVLPEGEASSAPDQLHEAPHLKEEYHRPTVGDEEDLEETGDQRSTSGKPPKCKKPTERLCSLQQKCQEEETTLLLKRSELCDVERSLLELQQQKQEAVQEIKTLKEENEQMKKEQASLELLLMETRAETVTARRELDTLERQKLLVHSGCRALDVNENRPDVVIVSVLEREEMERQLNSAKSDLFTEQRRARERVEAIQERLEEAHEELQKATESESSLRNRCVSLEEQHRQASNKLQTSESQARELQRALQTCHLTVRTLEKILSERELQLLDLQTLHSEVQTRREQLEGRVQQMKTQHYAALREAREQAHNALQTALQQHKKDLDLQHQKEVHKEQQRAAQELKQSEAEVTKLRRTLEERERAHSQSIAEGQQRSGDWALDLLTEVRLLEGVVQNNQTTKENNNVSATAEGALSALRTVREQVQSFSEGLQEELRSLKGITEHLHSEKERELSVQRQQLKRERDLALDSLKEHLIQEHIEELSSLRREGAVEGLLVCLRSQLRAKDSELRQVQRSMAQWKESTAQRMARKYEEELTAELERCKAKVLKCRTILKTHEDPGDPAVPKEALDSKERTHSGASAGGSSDSPSLKLLRHLQVKVKQLRRENPSHCICTPAPSTSEDKHL